MVICDTMFIISGAILPLFLDDYQWIFYLFYFSFDVILTYFDSSFHFIVIQ